MMLKHELWHQSLSELPIKRTISWHYYYYYCDYYNGKGNVGEINDTSGLSGH